jgi:hypothetical protein
MVVPPAGGPSRRVPGVEGREMSYEVQWSVGRCDQYDSYDEAAEAILTEYPDAVIGHDGDLTDGGYRTLAWADEASSLNDDGAHAVASIRVD